MQESPFSKNDWIDDFNFYLQIFEGYQRNIINTKIQ